MNRREFSGGPACLLAHRRPGPAGAGLRPSQEAGGGHGVPDAGQARACRGAAGQGRGHRVLLVQLPALQRLRAPAGGLDQEAARRRGGQARAGGLPRRLRAAAAPVLHARGHGQARRTAWQGVPGHPRRPRSRSTRKTPILAWAGKQGAGQGQVQGAVQLVLGVQQGAAAPRSCRRPTRSQGVPAHRHRRPLLHRRHPGGQHGPRACRSPTT